MFETPGSFASVGGGRHSGLVVISGSFSLVNAGIRAGLGTVRPDLDLDILDVRPIVRRQIGSLLRCGFAAAKDYGLASFRSRSTLMSRMMRTLAYNDEIGKIVRTAFAQKDYDFTLQTQSLFNAAQPGCPHYVYTDHAALARDYDGRDRLANRPSEAWLALERQLYCGADHVFTFGPNVRRLIVEKYGAGPDRVTAVGAGATVVPSGEVDTSIDRYQRRNILFVGVEWERKGGPELLAAFQLLRQRMTDATLTIVGCSPAIEAEGCRVMGRMPFNQLPDLFNAAACFCMPSRVEPFGIAYAEAQQFGLPVVATKVGDVGAIVKDGETGILVAPNDIGALADALEALLRQPDRCQALGRAGMERSQSLSWKAVAQRIARRLPGGEAASYEKIKEIW